MNSPCPKIVISAVLLAGLAAQASAVPMTANVSVTADDADGRSIDADFSISPNERLTLSAGAGHSESSDETADLSGTLLNAGASLHGDRVGASLSYDRFDDSSNYSSATVGARLWLTAGDFEFALLGRQRDMTTELTLQLPNRTLQREVDFSAFGAGLQVAFSHGNFSAYAMALSYDYGDDFDRFIALTESPQLVTRPLIEALVGSFATQAQGAIDRQAGVGVEQSFGRHAVGVDLSSIRDAIDETSSTSVALTWRYAQSAHLDWSLSGGMIDSDRYGNIGFVGVSLGVAN